MYEQAWWLTMGSSFVIAYFSINFRVWATVSGLFCLLVVSNSCTPLTQFLVIDYKRYQQDMPTNSKQPIPMEQYVPDDKVEPENIEEYKKYIYAFWIKMEMQKIPLSFFYSIIDCESAWKQYKKNGGILRSKDNAIGLMQVLETTAADYGVSNSDLKKAKYNIQAGMLHIKRLYDRVFNGNLEKVVTAYNLGEGNVKRGTKLRNKETVHYEYCVMGKFKGKNYLYKPCHKPYCLAIKSKANNAGMPHQGVLAFAAVLQSSLPGYWRMTSGHDWYHKKRYNSLNGHNKKIAFDFTTRGVNPKVITATIKSIMSNIPGIKWKYKHYDKCNGCTGLHEHFQFTTTKDAQKFLEWAVKEGKWKTGK